MIEEEKKKIDFWYRFTPQKNTRKNPISFSLHARFFPHTFSTLTHYCSTATKGKSSGKHKSKQMELTIKGWDGVLHTIELGVDDTPAVLRRKVASEVKLPEDGFCMSFGGDVMDENYKITQLSADDTIVLTEPETQKYEAIAALHALGEMHITKERLKAVDDPEVACLLLQAEVATVIPFEFLVGTSLTSLDVSAASVVTRISEHFLYECASLTSINLSGLTNVKVVGRSFLYRCSGLTTLDLSALSNLTKIEDSFLHGCTGLSTLGLSPLSNVTAIEDSFLADCSGLTTLELTPLSNLTKIENSFLSGCTGLTTLELSPLSNVTAIESNFLYRCSGLTTLNLAPLRSVTGVGGNFIEQCTSLNGDLGRAIYLRREDQTCSSAVYEAVAVVESHPEPITQSRRRVKAAQ